MKVTPFMVIFSLSLVVHAEEPRLISASGSNRVPLLELYSSESCSSCPPADRWVSTLKDRPDLWKTFVPVVFHVDYWNDLGWKDGLSSNSMTKRQRDEARTWGKNSVYTPGLVVDGAEWRGWPDRPLPGITKASRFKLSIYQEANGDLRVAVEGLPATGQYLVRVAKLGLGLSTHVTGGENSGRVLEHNFVVLQWDAKAVTSRAASASFHFDAAGKSAPRTAVAAWIEQAGSPIALQSAGGYL